MPHAVFVYQKCTMLYGYERLIRNALKISVYFYLAQGPANVFFIETKSKFFSFKGHVVSCNHSALPL